VRGEIRLVDEMLANYNRVEGLIYPDDHQIRNSPGEKDKTRFI